ncbi:MAG: hypothetical protein M5R40_25930 [Anaerolineae bacterium]|nr:hypothetical protein [Anaerolineae bacterium]
MPRPREGAWFRREWFEIVDAAPAKARRARYWDKAGTKDGGARTAGVLQAHADDGLIYIEDAVFGQWSAGEREAVIKQTAELDAQRYGSPRAVRIYIEQEPGSGGKESAEATIRNLKGFVVEADRPTGAKDTRLEPFAGRRRPATCAWCAARGTASSLKSSPRCPTGAFATWRTPPPAASTSWRRRGQSTGAARVRVRGLYRSQGGDRDREVPR